MWCVLKYKIWQLIKPIELPSILKIARCYMFTEKNLHSRKIIFIISIWKIKIYWRTYRDIIYYIYIYFFSTDMLIPFLQKIIANYYRFLGCHSERCLDEETVGPRGRGRGEKIRNIEVAGKPFRQRFALFARISRCRRLSSSNQH